MTEKYIDRFCRVCMNESHSYSLIYEEVYPDNSMLFEVINDVCQLEVTLSDELPRYICSDCSFKLSEFRKFKIRSHEVRASLERLKENIPHLYLDTPCESSLIGNKGSIKVEVEPEYSYEYASGGIESFEDYIGIEPDDLNLQTIGVENHDVIPARTDILDVDIKKEIEDPLRFDEDANDFAGDEEQEVDLKVDIKNEIEDPLRLDENVIDDIGNEVQKLDFKVTDLPCCTTDGDALQVTNQEHDNVGMKIFKAVKGKKRFRKKLLPGNIEGRKTSDEPEEGTSYGARRPIPCSNNDCVHFEGTQNPILENGSMEKCECHACRENSTSKTVIDKVEFHLNGGENTSNLGQLEMREYDDYIHQMLRIHGMSISRSNNIGCNKNISESEDLKKEKFSKSRVRNNIIPAKLDKKCFVCDICGRVFHRKGYLREHISIHMGKKFQCPICNKCFTSKAHVRIHLVVHDKSRHICTVCGKGFIQKDSLSTHLRIHTNERNYICVVCGKTFKRKTYLDVHMRVHSGERPFPCSICGKRLKYSSDLKQHMMVHSGISPFICDVCGTKFPCKSKYKIHMMRHGDEKPFSCDRCKKTFKVRDDLKVHLKLHEGLKPYKCSMCEKAFLRMDNLKVHLRSHTGEKPYLCPNCGKCFSHSSSVKVHLKSSCNGNTSKE